MRRLRYKLNEFSVTDVLENGKTVSTPDSNTLAKHTKMNKKEYKRNQ